MENRVYGLLGISSKAGKIVAGKERVEENIFKKKVKLVIIANDTSEKTIKDVKHLCGKQNIPVMNYGTTFDNSKAIGQINRAIIGVIDDSLAEGILKLIAGGEKDG